jgi:hypothetical protein
MHTGTYKHTRHTHTHTHSPFKCNGYQLHMDTQISRSIHHLHETSIDIRTHTHTTHTRTSHETSIDIRAHTRAHTHAHHAPTLCAGCCSHAHAPSSCRAATAASPQPPPSLRSTAAGWKGFGSWFCARGLACHP